MTYKKIVAYLIEESATTWVRNLLEGNNIEFRWTNTKVTEMENHDHNMLWTCGITVVLEDYRYVNLLVGGSADDMVGICNSVIWNDKHEVIWMNVPSTRDSLGITEFKVA